MIIGDYDNYYVLFQLLVYAYNTLSPVVGGDTVLASIMNNSKGACHYQTSLKLIKKWFIGGQEAIELL